MKNMIIFLIAVSLFFLFGFKPAFSFPANFPMTRALPPVDSRKPAPAVEPIKENSDWVTMPEGAKPAYMGIHGGTMPVSLLVSADGASLFTFVGRTGNDFLDAIRNAFLPLPSIGNSTGGSKEGLRNWQTGLFAGNATASMPVISLSGDNLARQAWFQQLQPFGLSKKALSIEGEVVKPEASSPPPRYRLFSLPDYFQPRRRTF